MSAADLTPEEDTVLLGLLREVIQADGVYSGTERAEMRVLKHDMGDARFDRAVAEAARRFTSRAALKDAAKAITRQAARAAMFAIIEKVAAGDGLTESEDAPIRWVASWWDIAR